MANAYSVLGQSNPSATTNTTLYTCPSSTQMVNGLLLVCNRSATPTSLRIAIRPAGASISNEHYVYYDLPIGGNDAFECLRGLSLEATDVVTVYATLATLSFTMCGVEIT